MGRAPDFIGLGAQRAGTSWIYACLYEHPEVCMPVKETHFFSREKNWSKGYAWYETLFEECPPEAKVGEFSTSYLVDLATPEHIYQRYPGVKLMASLRNPMSRAYSNYMNDIVAGVVDRHSPFRMALRQHPEYLEQGRYAAQLERYLQNFSQDRMLILIYENGLKDPLAFIQSIFEFLKVDESFVPSMLFTRVNEGRVPRFPWIDKMLREISAILRRGELSSLWWHAKRAGIGRGIRVLNTRQLLSKNRGLSVSDESFLYEALADDIMALEALLGRELEEWHP